MADALAGFAVIVLAAGASRRFGPSNKLIAPYRGRPLLSHILSTVDDLGVGQRIVVTGDPYRAEIAAMLAAHPRWAECVNPLAAEGLGGSIAAGTTRLGASEGVFICPGDMPCITGADFQAVAARFAGPRSICRPIHEGRPGHPVLFGADYFASLRGLTGDMGASGLISANLVELTTCVSANPGVCIDFDTPEAFACSCARRSAAGGRNRLQRGR
jgi:CTP:molybdopterin cytidylyltransferase MocA